MVKHEVYARDKDTRKKIEALADGMLANLDDYLDKVAEGEDKATIDLALVSLGRRLNPSCGCCFYLPPIDDL